jgi:hypothetical protein
VLEPRRRGGHSRCIRAKAQLETHFRGGHDAVPHSAGQPRGRYFFCHGLGNDGDAGDGGRNFELLQGPAGVMAANPGVSWFVSRLMSLIR